MCMCMCICVCARHSVIKLTFEPGKHAAELLLLLRNKLQGFIELKVAPHTDHLLWCSTEETLRHQGQTTVCFGGPNPISRK